MTSLLLPRQQQLNRLFHIMVVFAVLGPTLGVPGPGFKVTFFRVTFFLLVAGLIVRWVNKHSMQSFHMYHIRWHIAFFAFWTLYAAVSLTWAGHLGYGVRYTVFLVTMLLLTLSFPFFVKHGRNMEQTSRILFWVFFVLVVFGLIESLTFWHLPSSRYYMNPNAPNPTSFFKNQNDFATSITLGLPFVVTALYMLPMRRKTRWLIYSTGIIALCCLLMTGSRSNSGFALPLAGMAWMVLIPFTVERRKLTRKNLLKGVGLLVLAVLVVNLLTSTLLSQQARDKLGTTLGVIQDLQGSWQLPEQDPAAGEESPASGDQSINIRKALIINGLLHLHRSHYLGVGAGNIEYYMAGDPGVGGKTNMHNWWVEILVNFGVLIFTLYMFLYFWLLVRLWKLADRKNAAVLPPVIRWGATACLISLIGYFFGGMSPSTAIHFTPMWVVYGFALTVVAVGTRQLKKGTNHDPA
ncbi:O-antigen ligase family protein [Melghirimyces profundicolus]|uniref:O-antigen ligase family protein n=1 Tax=Melghirimyces profundicolus TaxID=1242148 RepID=UPI0011B22493|nr:O-antigen ligase family protein [Melghirimyces profundicolus]